METSVNVAAVVVKVGLLDLPIRDGNINFNILYCIINGPFRPSYQGWKLRHSAPSGIPRRPFRPSYQGWKHAGIATCEADLLLLDLPIRDGNSFSSIVPSCP